jgi:hypothetical protein
MGDRRGSYRALVGKPEAKKQLEDLSVDGRIISKCAETEWGCGLCVDLAQDRYKW